MIWRPVSTPTYGPPVSTRKSPYTFIHHFRNDTNMVADPAQGILLGLACGDALGRPVEFKSSAQIEAEYGTVTEMVGHGTWNQPAGTVTDDTQQALCIARSLVDCQSFNPDDIADRFVAWFDTDPFDIGQMTADALLKLKQGESWKTAGQIVWERRPEGSNAGNGSVMRCPPLSIPYRHDFETLARVSRESSRITHADPRCTYGCAVLNLTLAGILTKKAHPLEHAITIIQEDAPDELITAVSTLTSDRPTVELQSTGFVIHSLQTALHDALAADNFETAIVRAVNRGGDTDTIGAIAGAVAGARFGASGIPPRWRDAIDEATELRRLANELTELRL